MLNFITEDFKLEETMSKREEELERQMHEKAHISEKKIWKRIITTFFVLWAVVFIYHLKRARIDSFKDVLFIIGGSALLSALFMLSSWAVLSYIIAGVIKEEKDLSQIHGQLLERQYSRVFKDDE